MTSTPISLNDESPNGSWVDINSASQLHSPIGNDSPEYMRPPHSLPETVQNLGIISFQVERFLQEAQRFNNNDSNIGNINDDNNQQIVDNISEMYLSDSDLSADGLQESKSLIENLRRHQRYHKQYSPGNNNDHYQNQMSPEPMGERLSRSGECLLDHVSDSLSMLSRASFMAEAGNRHLDLDPEGNFQDFDWLWDWTAQPEYFGGQEWKTCPLSHQEFILKQQKDYCANLSKNQNHSDKYISGEMMSLLLLTNILSIILGAGLTYSIIMRRSDV